MEKFIEITDLSKTKRLINVRHISDVVDSIIYLDVSNSDNQVRINCAHTYEEIKMKIIQATDGGIYQ